MLWLKVPGGAAHVCVCGMSLILVTTRCVICKSIVKERRERGRSWEWPSLRWVAECARCEIALQRARHNLLHRCVAPSVGWQNDRSLAGASAPNTPPLTWTTGDQVAASSDVAPRRSMPIVAGSPATLEAPTAAGAMAWMVPTELPLEHPWSLRGTTGDGTMELAWSPCGTARAASPAAADIATPTVGSLG